MNQNEVIVPIVETGLPAIPEKIESIRLRIIQYDEQVKAGFQSSMLSAYMAGAALNQAKESVGKGKFGAWCEANLTLSNGTIHRYMGLAARIEEQFPTVGNYSKSLLLTDGSTSETSQIEEIKHEVEAAIHEIADGKTLTQMYRDLGVIKTPPPAGGFRPPEEAVQAWLKEHHPELVGKTYAELPAEIQAEFKAQWTPPVPSEEEIAEGHRFWMDKTLKELTEGLEGQRFAHATAEQRRALFQLMGDWRAKLSETFKADKKAAPKKSARKLSEAGKAAIAEAAKARWQAARAAKAQPKAA